MKSTKSILYPKECDELMDVLTEDYEFVAEEYPTAWRFRQFLRTLRLCDFSDILDDVYFVMNDKFEPVIMCRRIIFFSCLPKDMKRLTYILEALNEAAFIYDSDGEMLFATTIAI